MAPKKVSKGLSKVLQYYSPKMKDERLVCVVVDVDGDNVGNTYLHHNFADRKQLLVALLGTAKMELEKNGAADLGINLDSLGAVLEAIENASKEGHTVH